MTLHPFTYRSKFILCLCSALAVLMGCSKNTGGDRQTADAVEALSTEERLALPANAGNGARLFLSCAVCHDDTEGVGHRIGPNLYGVYGQNAAFHPDFAYSQAMASSDIIWDDDALDQYLANPLAFVPGGRMAYAGEPDPANRRDLIAYLKTLQ